MRPRARTKHFVMYARPNQLESARLGIVVAKRFAHRAVTRNTIKRLCRETFRCIQIPAMDCIIRLTSPVNTRKDPATNRQVKRILRAELDQLIASSGMNQKSRQ
ncbi:ribonuclease P protein component [Oxalobacter formigenes]